jgi:hypothetical protein
MKKANEWRNTETYKAQEEYNRNLQRIQIAEEESQTLQTQLKIDAIRKAGITEQEEKAKFAEALAGTGKSFEDLKTMSIDPSSESFKKLAGDMLNAGNITEEEFNSALKGAISPLDLMNMAAENAGSRLIELTDASINAADALGKKLTQKALEDAGVNTALVEAQLAALNNFKEQTANISQDLMVKYGDALTEGLNTTAAGALSGKDADSKAFMADLKKQFAASGATDAEIDKAMKNAADIFAKDNITLDSAENIQKLMDTVNNQLERNITQASVKAEAEGSQAKVTALKRIEATGATDVVSKVDISKLQTDKKLQETLTSLGIEVKKDKKGKVDPKQLGDIQKQLTEKLTELAGTDAAKFNEALKGIGGTKFIKLTPGAQAPGVPAPLPQAPGAPSPVPQVPGVPSPVPQAPGVPPAPPTLPPSQPTAQATQPAEAPKVGKALALGGMGIFGGLASFFSPKSQPQPTATQPAEAPKEGKVGKALALGGMGVFGGLASLFSSNKTQPAAAQPAQAPKEGSISKTPSILGGIGASLASLFSKAPDAKAPAGKAAAPAGKAGTPGAGAVDSANKMLTEALTTLNKSIGSITPSFQSIPKLFNSFTTTLAKLFNSLILAFKTFTEIQVQLEASKDPENKMFEDIFKNLKGVTGIKVKDGSTVSNKGPFTISDKFGNVAITHPQDKLVVSPNISYVNDGATPTPQNKVFPVSEGFGALDVKVSPKKVLVQKVKDALVTKNTLSKESSIAQNVKDALTVKDALVTKETLSKESSIAQKVKDALVTKEAQKVKDALVTKETLSTTQKVKDALTVKDALITKEALVKESSITQKVKDALVTKNTLSKESSIAQKVKDALVTKEIQRIKDALITKETSSITQNVKDALVTKETLVKESSTSQKVKDALTIKETSSIAQKVKDALVTKETLSKESSIAQKIKDALITKETLSKESSIAQKVKDALITKETLSKESSIAQKVKDALVTKETSSIAQKVKDALVTKETSSIAQKVKDALVTKETSSTAQNVKNNISSYLTSELKTFQHVSDGSSSSKGPFTIADRFGNVAVTHPKDGIVVSPNISYVNDGVTGKKGPVFPVSEKFGALDVKVSPKGVMVQKVNDGVGSNLVSVSQSISENLSLEEAAMPKLAEGGMVSKPTVALIGEAGPEAVVPLDQIAQESPQTSTTVIESDNSDLKKELQEMKQLMAGLISQIPSIANRPITVELNGNKVGQALGQNAYRM